jgi:hypothetical protein
MSNTAGSGKRPGPELQHVPCVAAGPPAGSAAADVRRVLPPAPAGQPGGVLPGAAVAAAGQPAVLQPPAQPPSQQQHPKQPGPAAAPAPAAGAPQAPSSNGQLLRPSLHSSSTAPAATAAPAEAPAAAAAPFHVGQQDPSAPTARHLHDSAAQTTCPHAQLLPHTCQVGVVLSLVLQKQHTVCAAAVLPAHRNQSHCCCCCYCWLPACWHLSCCLRACSRDSRRS